MVPKTRRPVGKISPSDVRNFQQRYGIQVDGKVGNQTWGQVLMLEYAYDELKAKPEASVSVWGGLGIVVAAIVAWAAGFFGWVGSFFVS